MSYLSVIVTFLSMIFAKPMIYLISSVFLIFIHLIVRSFARSSASFLPSFLPSLFLCSFIRLLVSFAFPPVSYTYKQVL